jgi:hypothetical protein
MSKAEKISGGEKEHPGQQNLRSLIFIINGEEEIVEKVNTKQPLKVVAEKALTESGNTKSISDYQAVYNDKEITLDKKVEDYDFPATAKIFLNLNTAGGGTGFKAIC